MSKQPVFRKSGGADGPGAPAWAAMRGLQEEQNKGRVTQKYCLKTRAWADSK
uniref:Uncharacterized protein n=1 Tax=Thermogemmatispora argillosa TaxID=2045280 RepID=A0A455T3Y7_9CHLR|nr:hypothetical protein KTA_23180 [Thermogemmatispora argillosa]